MVLQTSSRPGSHALRTAGSLPAKPSALGRAREEKRVTPRSGTAGALDALTLSGRAVITELSRRGTVLFTAHGFQG